MNKEYLNNPTIKQAIEDSIKHWERMRDDRDCKEMPWVSECSLCKLFYDDGNCSGCPIAKHTKHNECIDTPFYAARKCYYERHTSWEDWQEAANEEVEFLKSLL